MLKLVGMLLVAVGTAGFGFYLKQGVRCHIQMLYEIKRALICIRNNLSYTHKPMGEIFHDAGETTKGIVQTCMYEMEQEIGQLSEAQVCDIWTKVLLLHRSELGLCQEELHIFDLAGKNLGVLDLQQQLEMISLSQQQLEEKIAMAQREQKDKEKVYQSLSIMAGLFIIVILL